MLKRYGQYTYSYDGLDNDIDFYFEFKNLVVFTNNKKTIKDEDLSKGKSNEIIITMKNGIDQDNNPLDLPRYIRGEMLIVQGIISFFIGYPITVYDVKESTTKTSSIHIEKQETYFAIGNKDYTLDLIKTLSAINKEPELIITLLDRWRKAIYLKKESVDADLFYDESIINFFHILELLGESVNSDLKKKLEKNIEEMLKAYYNACYYSESKIEQMVLQNKKTISRVLMGENLNLSSKIKHYLKKHKMLNGNTSFFIDSIIKVRNAVAHGRITYYDKFIWPLSPFFNLAKDAYENIDFLFLITATMISNYIGIERWKDEWEELKIYLPPSNETVNNFLEDKLINSDIDFDTFLKGNQYNITWGTLFNQYLKKPQKKYYEKLEKKVRNTFIKAQIDEQNAPDMFNISLIFADSKDFQIKEKAIENIKLIIRCNWYGYFNFKDAYSYLNFYNIELGWYKEFLNKKEYLKLY